MNADGRDRKGGEGAATAGVVPLEIPTGGARAWFIWSLSAMAFGYAFFQRVAPSVMVSDLMAQFAIGGGMLGVLSALYFYPYVVMQVPLGALLDRMGARMLLCSALTLAGIGSFMFGSAETLWLAYAGRILIGVGSAVGFLGSLALASKWFPPNRFAMLAGMTMFFGMMSGVVAQGPLALFVEAFGWRASQWALGGFGLFLALLVLIFVRNAPPQMEGAETSDVQPWSDVWRGLKRAASYGHVWKIALVACTMSGPMLTLGGLWGTPYLMAGYGLEKAEAAFYLSILLFGWAIGAPCAGWLSDRLQRRKGIMVAGNIALSTALALICFVPPISLAFTVVLLFTVGAAGGCMAVSFALVRESSPPNISGSVTGIVNGATVASGAALQPLVGWVLDLVWNGKTVDGLRIYETADYQTGFIPIFLTACIGLIFSVTLREAQRG